jgi:hypothetical protein
MGAQTNPLSFTLAPGMAPAAPLLRLLSRFDRQKVEAFAEISIALLDLIDPDSDLEDDDPAGQCDEDGINTDLERAFSGSPGCAISDNDHEHDGREEEAGY